MIVIITMQLEPIPDNWYLLIGLLKKNNNNIVQYFLIFSYHKFYFIISS